MSNIIAFDFGTSHIGVAVGNTTTYTARPLEAIKAKDGIPNAQALAKVIKDWEPTVLVVGLPINMDGTEQLMTARARKFGNRLKATFNKQVCFIDERLTSAEAKSHIFDKDGFRALVKDKGRIDCVSAAEILEQYFSENSQLS